MLLKFSKLITLLPRKWTFRYLRKKTHPIDPGLYVLNLVVQRIFRINCHIPWMVNFTSRVAGDIEIGKNVWISFAVSGGCYIQGINKIFIDDYTIFAPGVKIISANHDTEGISNFVSSGPIVIGKQCWIGTNAVLLPGVKLGDNTIVGAGSIVNKSFPPNSLIGGNPAKLIERIGEKSNYWKEVET